jgi:hypothetical protein
MDFQVLRKDYRQTRWIETPPEAAIEPGEGEALVRIRKFAFTANNITYAVVGDMIGYWKCFPAEGGWGHIPVWGIGEVVKSKAEGVGVGDRFFGYFPMASHLKVSPVKVSATGFFDGAAHRQALPPTYNQYRKMTAELGFDPAEDDAVIVFWPLFMTAFLIDDFLAQNGFFGAKRVLLSSASSKTAFGTAFLLHARGGLEVAGLTSAGNRGFVEGLGCYDRVVTYSELTNLESEVATVFVDMAGNSGTLAAVHEHFGDGLKHSCRVGMTHWEANAPLPKLPGPAPAFFFAPDQATQRLKEWGPEGLQQRFAGAWASFMEVVNRSITFERGEGADDVERVYRATLEGAVAPDRAQVLTI